jgi:hypothetical protein
MKHRLMSFVNQLLRAVDLALVRCPRELSANSESRLESGVRHAIADNVLIGSRWAASIAFYRLALIRHLAPANPYASPRFVPFGVVCSWSPSRFLHPDSGSDLEETRPSRFCSVP